MSNNGTVEFTCLEVTQPIGTFYIGAINSKDLIDISYADVRRIEERDIERVVGIQRPLVSARVKELKEYVQTIDATFPTSVILATKSGNAIYDPQTKKMKIGREEDAVKIIDGQHRIAGLKGLDKEFQLNVTIFVDMDLEDQAMVFATINLKQTKVNKSLAYDLYELASSRSPQKTCHNIAKLLDSKETSPFKNKIKILGRAVEKSETLTQAIFVENLLQYISGDTIQAMKDRDSLKRGRKLEHIESPLVEKLIFRNMFIDKRDVEIAKVLFNYFGAVSEVWHDAWFTEERGKILSRSTGFAALMRFLRDFYVSFNKPSEIISQKSFLEIFSQIEMREDDFNPQNFPPGKVGETKLYKELLRLWRREKGVIKTIG